MPTPQELYRQRQLESAKLGDAVRQGIGNFFGGVGRFFSGPPTSLSDPIISSKGNSASYKLGPTHLGPAYQDSRFLVPKRGKVGGGNAGASIANQWPAALRGPGSVSPIVTGLDRGGNIDRTQSDQYRAAMGQQAPVYQSFPLTPQGQFERYFSSGSPEMDRYFGAASRGAGAPKSLEEMNALASQRSAPTSAPLSTYYRAQSAAGRGSMDEILDAMEYKGTPLEAWAKANPMLAQREYNKRFPGGRSASPFPAGSVANLNVPVEGAFAAGPLSAGVPEARQAPAGFNPAFTRQDLLGGANPFQMPALAQTSAPAPGSTQGMDTSQLYGKGAPNLAAFTQPGGAMTQGLNVSAPFKQASDIASMYTNPQNAAGIGELQQADNTLQGRLKNFLAGVRQQ